MPLQPKKHRGAPPGNQNNFKHGFYSRRLKKRDLTGVEAVDSAGLLEEIALIRLFTRQLLESFSSNPSSKEHAEILRILCLASLEITRVIKAQTFFSTSGSGTDVEISEAIRQVNAEFRAILLSIKNLPVGDQLSHPSSFTPLTSTTEEA